MHRSRLAALIVDCHPTSAAPDAEAAARFWSQALGLAAKPRDAAGYVPLEHGAHSVRVEVQPVTHPSRVHLDIETDDVEAEVARLEGLGAKRVEQVRGWWVMEAPTGHRFCVVLAHSLEGAAETTTWP